MALGEQKWPVIGREGAKLDAFCGHVKPVSTSRVQHNSPEEHMEYYRLIYILN